MQHSASAPRLWRTSVAPEQGAATAGGAALAQKRPAPRRHTVRLTAFTTALSGALAFAAMTHWGADARQVRPVLDEADRIAELAGLGVRQVFLSGHRMTADSDIFDALDLANARSLLRFDSLAARARIERLSWVETAAITRIFPDSISIEIAERRPFAVWHRSGRDLLIDATGRILSLAPPGIGAELPRISGEGAGKEAAGLLAAVEQHPALAARIQEAVRVAGRRWTLRLTGGPEIHLPAGREAEALELLTAERVPSQLLDGRRHASVDLRAPDRIVLRPKHDLEKQPLSGRNAEPSG